jgi:hypothetical protein
MSRIVKIHWTGGAVTEIDLDAISETDKRLAAYLNNVIDNELKHISIDLDIDPQGEEQSS